MDFNQCPCSGKTLAKLVQPAVLAAVAKESLHGYLLLQRLAAMPMFQDQPPDPTGVYRILKAMEHEGLLRSSWASADAGPAKRAFAITPGGRACLAEWTRSLVRYQDMITQLLITVRRSTPARSRRVASCDCKKKGAGCA